MELFRVNQNPWGQEILQGISWDLLWLFGGASLAFIVIHLLYMKIRTPRSGAGQLQEKV